MRRWPLSCLALLFFLGTAPVLAQSRPHDGVEYVKLQAAGVPIHLVSVNLGRGDLVLRPVVAPTGQRYSMQQFVKAHRPIAAVNGTFFDTLTGITVGNLVSQGRLLAEGMTGSSLLFHRDGRIELLSSQRNLGRYHDWAEVDFAIGGGPTLLANGQYVMDPKGEGFRDPALFRPRPRTAIGVTADNKLRMVVVTHGVTLWTLAHIMKDLGCVHALNLDGGSSSAMTVAGSTKVAPQRRLTNMIGVFSLDKDANLVRAVGVAETRASQHYLKGLEYQRSGRPLEARSQMRQAVAKSPAEPLYWKAAGLAEQVMNNRPRAIADLVRAAELFMSRGDMVASEEVSRLILNLDESHLRANLVCGEALIEQGRDQEAVPYLQVVLESAPGHERATELLEGVQFRARSQEALRIPVESVAWAWVALGLQL